MWAQECRPKGSLSVMLLVHACWPHFSDTVTSASRVNSHPGIGREDTSGYWIMLKQHSGLLQGAQWSVRLGEKPVWVSIDSFLFSDTGWKLGGWQSILESPLEVIKSIVQPKQRGSLAESGRHGPLRMPCCPIKHKEWHSGTLSPSLWCLILPRSFLFHNTGAKGRQFFSNSFALSLLFL